MKFKVFAVVLALSLMAWAQENPATSNPNSTPKTKSCCHHGQGEQGAMSCGHHASADGKDAIECCKGSGCCGKEGAKCEKDGKSCCGGKDLKAPAKECKKNGGCADGKCCGAKGEKTAMKCCNGCEKKNS